MTRKTDDHKFIGELIDLCEKYQTLNRGKIESLAVTGLDFFIELVRHTRRSDEEAIHLIDADVKSIFEKPSNRF
tara:strand:+ start:2018 stop:2239 length:222 start_codon:yes stop_codon:yes gene_type:complete